MAKRKQYVWLGEIPNCFGEGIVATGQSESQVKRLLRQEYKAQYEASVREFGPFASNADFPNRTASWPALEEYFSAWIEKVPIGAVAFSSRFQSGAPGEWMPE